MQIATDSTVIGLPFRNGSNWREAFFFKVPLDDSRRYAGQAPQALICVAPQRLSFTQYMEIANVGGVEFAARTLNSESNEVDCDLAGMSSQSSKGEHGAIIAGRIRCSKRCLPTPTTGPTQITTRRLQ